MKVCSVEGCGKKVSARDWCKMHYTRWLRHGDHLFTRYAATPDDALASRTEWLGDCLVWTGIKNNHGYGIISVENKKTYAHRYAWEAVYGKIPKGKVVDHICYNPSCVNTEHLRVTTQAKNTSNRSGPQINNRSSGVRNVYRFGDRWKVQIKKNGVQNHFGVYDTIEEAASVAKDYREKLFGEYAGEG